MTWCSGGSGPFLTGSGCATAAAAAEAGVPGVGPTDASAPYCGCWNP